MGARVLLIGIYVQCDDHGIFEYRPKSLKAAIFPGDDGIAIAGMLSELEKYNCIRTFSIDGKIYGAVRNFCKYQRPKKPTYWYPVRNASMADLPDWFGPYVAFGSKSVDDESPTSTEKPPHKEKEKEKEREKEKPQTITESVERVPPTSERKPPAAPSETLSPKKPSGLVLGKPLPVDWVPDEQQCESVKLEFGMTDEDLQREVPAFHALNVANGVLSQNWSATFYLFCKRWQEHKAKQAAPRVQVSRSPPSKTVTDLSEQDWDGIVKLYAKGAQWSRHGGPDPTSPACKAPREILERYGINPETGERSPKQAMSA